MDMAPRFDHNSTFFISIFTPIVCAIRHSIVEKGSRAESVSTLRRITLQAVVCQSVPPATLRMQRYRKLASWAGLSYRDVALRYIGTCQSSQNLDWSDDHHIYSTPCLCTFVGCSCSKYGSWVENLLKKAAWWLLIVDFMEMLAALTKWPSRASLLLAIFHVLSAERHAEGSHPASTRTRSSQNTPRRRATSARPHIIFILADDLVSDDIPDSQ